MSSITNKRVLCSPPQNTVYFSHSLSSSLYSIYSSPPSYSEEEYKTPKIPDTIPPPDYETDEEFKHFYSPQDGDEEIRNTRLRLQLKKRKKSEITHSLHLYLPPTDNKQKKNKDKKNDRNNDRKKRQKNQEDKKQNEQTEETDYFYILNMLRRCFL